MSEAAAAVRQRPRRAPRAAADRRRRPRIREAGPAGAHARRAASRSGSSWRASWPRPRRAAARAASRWRAGTLFLFDEPTTGLHFDDIAKLMRALRKLLEAGHSLVVIEHNLDVIRASDWLIDLGPEGGDGGGQVVADGTPEEVRENRASHTGEALARLRARDRPRRLQGGGARGPLVRGARQAGRGAAARSRSSTRASTTSSPSRSTSRTTSSAWSRACRGSGKSTLAFDILFNEGPAPLPRIAQRLCAQHRAAGGTARGGRGLRHPADGGDRAAAVARRPQVAPWAPPPRSGISCGCCTSSWASSTASTTAPRCGRRRPTASPRS